MLKKWMWLITIAIGLLGVLPAWAADGWYAFIYNSAARQLVRVGLDGTQATFDLGLDENVFLSGFDMAASVDGNRIAFCASSARVDSPQSDTTLIVRDLAAQANVLALPLGVNMSCRVTHASLKADASQVAVSLVKYYPGSPDMDTDGPIWRLLVVDVASGSILSEINAESLPVMTAGVQGGVALLPEVRSFSSNQIVFAEIPYGIGGAPEWNAFVWHLDSGAVEADTTGIWGKSGLSINPATGETIWLDQDPNRPAADPGGPIPAFNVVVQADSSGT
ncbi:MAG: hypothetical protein K8J31_06875, partial [Anaerolineae bacterium]|nr:hypothetical protein [Anaerolineae bacterium]